MYLPIYNNIEIGMSVNIIQKKERKYKKRLWFFPSSFPFFFFLPLLLIQENIILFFNFDRVLYAQAQENVYKYNEMP